jgi:hypothetical protein
MPGKEGSINEAGLNVGGFQPRITPQDGGGIITRGKHIEDVFHRQSAPTDDRFTAESIWIASDALDEFLTFRQVKIEGRASWNKVENERRETLE